jgi:DNA-binding Lrp family transcriptional regulator
VPARRSAAVRLDARTLEALTGDPRATVMAIAERTRLSRNTVQARLKKFERSGVLRTFEHRVDPAALGHPLTAFIR